MKKIFRNIMMLMAVPAMLMTTACESMDDTNVDPTRMNSANAGSFMDPLIYGMGTYAWSRYNSWTFQLMQCLVTTNSTSGVGWFNISDTAGDGVWTNYYKWNTNAKVHISGIAPDEAPMTRPSDLSSYKSLSEFFINRLQAWKDPRMAVFAKQATNKNPETGKNEKSYIGLPSGYDVEPTFTASSPNAANLATAPQDIQCLTYAEVLFIKAELAQRGIISDDAKQLYEKAVTAAITQWGVEVPEAYFENEKAAYDGTLRRIMEQKFYALFFIDFQQWFEYNRTGYPDVPKGPGVDASLHMPYRFKYPAILQRMNREHYLEAVQSMGGDDFDTKLIWQKRPEL